jgi:hypothetical protein
VCRAKYGKRRAWFSPRYFFDPRRNAAGEKTARNKERFSPRGKSRAALQKEKQRAARMRKMW